MPPRITDSQRKMVLELLAQGFDRETVAVRVGVTRGQVSAVVTHVKVGNYDQCFRKSKSDRCSMPVAFCL